MYIIKLMRYDVTFNLQNFLFIFLFFQFREILFYKVNFLFAVRNVDRNKGEINADM